ncbi:MAG: rhodanese-like domain-containing protein [Burkholderiales bacterium]
MTNEIDSMRLREMQAGGNLRLVDVRSDAEVARGMIAGAQHIPLNQLAPKAEEWDQQAPLVFCCQSGARSAQAAQFFAGKGFTQVYNLQGGLNVWVRNGLPLSGA